MVTDVEHGTSVWIPAHAEHFYHNRGTESLKLLYVFPRGKYSDVHYNFPGETEAAL
jgi:oxalate decarboxylase/phosphoglucose isomerase-like protein (cupin superfamily)